MEIFNGFYFSVDCKAQVIHLNQSIEIDIIGPQKTLLFNNGIIKIFSGKKSSITHYEYNFMRSTMYTMIQS